MATQTTTKKLSSGQVMFKRELEDKLGQLNIYLEEELRKSIWQMAVEGTQEMLQYVNANTNDYTGKLRRLKVEWEGENEVNIIGPSYSFEVSYGTGPRIIPPTNYIFNWLKLFWYDPHEDVKVAYIKLYRSVLNKGTAPHSFIQEGRERIRNVTKQVISTAIINSLERAGFTITRGG